MKYYLTENNLSEETNYIARILAKPSIDQEALIDKMLSKRNLISKTDVVAVLNFYYEEIGICINEGNNLNLPLFNLSYSIKGNFESEEDYYNPEKHKLEVNIHSRKIIKNIEKHMPLEKVTVPRYVTHINTFEDYASKTINTYLTPNSIFEILGTRLKIAGEDEEAVGVYFVSEDQTEYKVSLVVNQYKKLIGQVPELEAGNYTIRIKTQATKGSKAYLKHVRIIDSTFTLTVV
ncbi:DNA-binding domain-containing protein [Tenacibaculum sp. 190524A02b]|uniref:DUF4469 domain-containing protein n=1 Tax=Tenacibaculum vairaonense TaxID=3137860 RepID=A0ABP1FDP0_9FLAO